jgi:CRISPR-associated protein Cmr1
MPRHPLTKIPQHNTLTATFEIVTPMFLGDAEQKATAIRPTSIKGALRFWWRALNGHLSLAELAEKEARLFGSTDGGGVFRLSVSSVGKFQPQTDWPIKDPNNASSYMGYGLIRDGQNPQREYIPANLFFEVTLSFQANAGDADKQSVQTALEAFGLFGSLGSRARRGFGSIQLTKLNDRLIPAPTKESLKQWFQQHLSVALKDKNQLNYTAFGSDSYFALPSVFLRNSYTSAHFSMGASYQLTRKELKTTLRAVYGLPLKNVNEKLRRASPVLFKVIKTAQGKYQGMVLFLPSQFHPDFSSADYQYVQPLLTAIQAEKCA